MPATVTDAEIQEAIDTARCWLGDLRSAGYDDLAALQWNMKRARRVMRGLLKVGGRPQVESQSVTAYTAAFNAYLAYMARQLTSG